MFEDIKTHIMHYAILATILIIGFGSILIFSSGKQIQLFLIVATTILYAFWGIIHHYMEDELNLKIVIEYILIALLIAIILLTILLRR